MTSKNRYTVLQLLMSDSKMSDRIIAKQLGISQPTVSRMRASLKKDGIIRRYVLVPDLAKLGYSVILSSTVSYANSTELDKLQNRFARDDRVFFAGKSRKGTIVVLSKHIDAICIMTFMDEYNTSNENFISTKDGILKDPAITRLAPEKHKI